MANDISPTSKRRKLVVVSQQQHQDLLPGLPDHIAQVCLSLVDPYFLFSVCRSWRRLIYSPSFPPFLSLYALFSIPDPQTQTQTQTHLRFQSFDPISSLWRVLPTPPLRLLLRHPSFVSRHHPLQSVSVAGNLALLAATAENLVPALPQPLVFDPSSCEWAHAPPLSPPRRWCAAGTLRGSVYVASGIGSQFSHDVARSVERWDPRGSGWERVSDLRDGRFSRDAIDAVGWRGKLCMVNVRGGALKDGVVYDADKDTWQEMPEGMIGGWRGPVAAMDEDEMFMVDEAKGALRRYDPGRDSWVEVMESERLRGAEQIAAGGGRVCVVCSGTGGKGIVVVDVATAPARLWSVETPEGLEAVAVHVLPRITAPLLPST
ncbi:F-box domain containing protein [Parasponia andersonii]|uniref:F-box domain containing protein n=1 Tax=Parasponia andersonii TaxID=3476 RepID=A0A2P5BFK0_PARAD|nr:F-box domain containing protein [Parasponia andersonii]